MSATLITPAVNKAKMPALETQTMHKKDAQDADAAQGATLATLGGLQTRLEKVVAACAAKGIKVSDADLAKLQTAGITEGQAQQIMDAVAKAESAAEGQLLVSNFAEALENVSKAAAMISGGEEISKTAFFAEMKHGLEAAMSPEKLVQKLIQENIRG